jgi:hypothetical protein
MTVIAPPQRSVLADLEQRVTDPPAAVCHLVDRDGASHTLCGAPTYFVNAIYIGEALRQGDPGSSPCAGDCGRQRCARCAAEYAMRKAHA